MARRFSATNFSLFSLSFASLTCLTCSIFSCTRFSSSSSFLSSACLASSSSSFFVSSSLIQFSRLSRSCTSLLFHSFSLSRCSLENLFCNFGYHLLNSLTRSSFSLSFAFSLLFSFFARSSFLVRIQLFPSRSFCFRSRSFLFSASFFSCFKNLTLANSLSSLSSNVFSSSSAASLASFFSLALLSNSLSTLMASSSSSCTVVSVLSVGTSSTTCMFPNSLIHASLLSSISISLKYSSTSTPSLLRLATRTSVLLAKSPINFLLFLSSSSCNFFSFILCRRSSSRAFLMNSLLASAFAAPSLFLRSRPLSPFFALNFFCLPFASFSCLSNNRSS
mmetsp:Transcript_20847/g.38984  ORF Transcript_20847/g.38984 Transcript_20847/m.38984 type:complete len:334 (+) Transcript_20847:371-1372(+)